MRLTRVVLATAGTGLFAFAIAVLLVGRGLLGPMRALVQSFQNGYVLVATVGVGALAIVLFVLLTRAVGGIDQAEPPDPETARTAPPPGTEFDERVGGGLDLGTLLSGERRDAVRTRLRRAAVTALQRETDVTAGTARTQVARGTWTDDELAASFLSTSRSPTGGSRLAAMLRGQTRFQHAARHTASVIVDVDEEARR